MSEETPKTPSQPEQPAEAAKSMPSAPAAASQTPPTQSAPPRHEPPLNLVEPVKPEIAVGIAFAGGIILARMLRRLGG